MTSYTRRQCKDDWNRFGKLAII